MATVFDDSLFRKTNLTREFVNEDSREIWEFTTVLSQKRNNYLAELIKNESKGYLKGRLIKIRKDSLDMPLELPDWFVPGVIFNVEIDSLIVALTVRPKFQSSINGLNEILGLAVEFDFSVVSEFYDHVSNQY